MLKRAGRRIHVATKCGRYINPHVNEGYTPQSLRKYVEASLKRLDVECIDIIQLHCPPVEVYYRPEIFDFFETFKKEGKILHLGVSVEKVEEALKAVEFDNVATVQIIYNIFRQRPAERFFGIAREKNVGIICRVPLASGLLAGKFTRSTQFGKGDHRRDNRKGEMFDRGETFSGIPFEEGLKSVDRLKGVFSGDVDLAHAALKWILMREEIGCIIPGASSVEQVQSNIQAADFPDLLPSQIDEIDGIYRDTIKPLVHHLW
jgi:aryl-alcohol dehydrogenase-like predicted oxidoreductase